MYTTLNNGDEGNVIHTLLLPLANVFLPINIVRFVWDGISGRGVIDHVEICHGNKLAEGEI